MQCRACTSPRAPKQITPTPRNRAANTGSDTSISNICLEPQFKAGRYNLHFTNEETEAHFLSVTLLAPYKYVAEPVLKPKCLIFLCHCAVSVSQNQSGAGTCDTETIWSLILNSNSLHCKRRYSMRVKRSDSGARLPGLNLGSTMCQPCNRGQL